MKTDANALPISVCEFGVGKLSCGIAQACRCFFLVLVLVSLSLIPRVSEASTLPNVVFILVDDLGWSQTSPYGSTFYETPGLDVLAQEGMVFHNAYSAAAVCSPTRAAIQTGKHPARLHLTDYIPGESQIHRPLREPNWRRYLPLSEYTLGEFFQDADYVTAYFGKWHLSPGKKLPKSLLHNPWNQGFDESLITFRPYKGITKDRHRPENDDHNVKMLTKQSLDFMSRNKNVPFFLMVSHNAVHTPLREREQSIQKYAKKPGVNLPQNNPLLGAMIKSVDSSTREILKKLDDLGLSEKTIVIFYSDNGGYERDALQVPLRGGKGLLYEGGVRVPLIVRWPGIIERASHNYALVTSTDFFPTFMEILGEKEKKNSIILDGESMFDLLSGRNKQSERTIFWHYPHYNETGMKPAGALRRGKFKLIEWYGANSDGNEKKIELYDLSTDIGETQNLVKVLPDKTRELRKALEAWRTEVGAQMPVENTDFSPYRK